MSSIQLASQEIQSMYQLGAIIDLQLKKLKKKAIFNVGLSRTGKSTLYNFINQIKLVGVLSQGSFISVVYGPIDVIYEPKFMSSTLAQANNGVYSVTLVPNIHDNGENCLVDMPGYLDRRKYNAVIGVSWVIKGAFEVVEECQFILLIKNDCFKNAGEGELFKTLKGFANMFNSDLLSDDLKMKIMQSVTFVIAKSQKNAKVNGYTGRMEKLIEKTEDPEYGDEQTIEQISFVMKYFAKHPEQIYLFTAAELGEESPQCTLYNDHFNKRPYFQIKKQDENLFKQKEKHIYRLPFAEDDEEMRQKDKKLQTIYQKKLKKQTDQAKKNLIKKPVTDLSMLEKQLDDRVNSFTLYAKILEKFFRKAINPINFFDQNLNFQQEFQQIKQFIVKYQIYPRSFDFKDQTGLTTRFKVGDPPKKLKAGMILARKVFKLYKAFSNTPAYNNEEESSVLGIYLQQYKKYLVELASLFRDTFCTRYDQEQLILQFLFVGVRGCHEFLMLYEIRPDGKHNTCHRLKDSFQQIFADKPWAKIQQEFVKNLRENIDKVIARMQQSGDEIDEYVDYLKDLKRDKQNLKLIQSDNYKTVYRIVLELISQQTTLPQQTLIYTFESFIEHIKLVEERISQLDNFEDDYPDELSFKLIHQLSNMGRIILNLTRPNNVFQDCFAYDRFDEIKLDRGKRTIQQYLIIEQAITAIQIFKYTKDTESILQAHEEILKNLPPTENAEKINYMKSMARCCADSGRTEQAIIIYQKALQTCALANLNHQYKEIKQILRKIPDERSEKNCVYFNNLKHNAIIDPQYDQELKYLIKNIKGYFIEPYYHRRERN